MSSAEHEFTKRAHINFKCIYTCEQLCFQLNFRKQILNDSIVFRTVSNNFYERCDA